MFDSATTYLVLFKNCITEQIIIIIIIIIIITIIITIIIII